MLSRGGAAKKWQEVESGSGCYAAYAISCFSLPYFMTNVATHSPNNNDEQRILNKASV